MKTLVILPLAVAAALGLSACSKQATNENVSVNETSINELSADTNSVDNAASETLDNGTNSADALTNS